MSDKGAKQEIKKLSELLTMNLTIPDYQRPYKWQEKNVIQLLDDIQEHVIEKRKKYRIGSLILYSDGNSGEYNIVDGQQRLTTLSILLSKLNETQNTLSKLKYKHKISIDNIIYNSRIIQNRIEKFNDKEFLKKLILEKCEFVVFTVYDQDEAFQLFDSQNSRGKELEPYDLLKAFHLREMQNDSEEEREMAVERWERAVDNNTLKEILGNHLFKIRKWVKNENKYNFTKDDIDEFKGISLNKSQQYPYESSLRMLDGLVDDFQKNKILKNLQVAQSYPFSIVMPIINGKRFFEYVNYYISLKETIIPNDKCVIDPENKEFYEFYQKKCKNYSGAYRTGDWRVRNLYENILLMYVDRFGKISANELLYESLYRATYSIRCNNKAIRLETILNSDERKILQEINNSIYPEKLNHYLLKRYSITKKDEDMVNGIGTIRDFINQQN